MQPDLFNIATGTGRTPAGTIFTTSRRFERTNNDPPHYYRCGLCLSTFTTESALPRSRKRHGCADALCACGNDVIDYLGQSTLDKRLTREVDRCPCDMRCTGATGPNCTCRCGGVNHGTNLLVRVTLDGGPTPRIEHRTPDVAKAHRAAFEKASAESFARLESKFAADLPNYRAGVWLPRETWDSIRITYDQIHHARNLKTQKGRMTALEKICK